jgi:hypothetical protein
MRTWFTFLFCFLLLGCGSAAVELKQSREVSTETTIDRHTGEIVIQPTIGERYVEFWIDDYLHGPAEDAQIQAVNAWIKEHPEEQITGIQKIKGIYKGSNRGMALRLSLKSR